MEKMLLTPTEAATTLGIGRSKLYELMRAGVVPSVRIGAHRRVPADRVHGSVGAGRPVARRRRRSALKGCAGDGHSEGR